MNSEHSLTVSRHELAADRWLTPGRFSVILAILIFAAYPDVVLGIRTFGFRDFIIFGHPVAFYMRESFWRAEVPLWNPLNNCRIPFLAQWNTLGQKRNSAVIKRNPERHLRSPKAFT